MTKNSKLPMWIDDGLKFKCTGCGACCTGSPGYVWLEDQDIENLKRHLKMTKEELIKKYCRQIGDKISLIEDSKTYDCIFLKENKCSLYGARPKQCRVYPFWNDVMKNKKTWDNEANHCEGINHKEGKLFTKEDILKIIS
ncbi:MAG: hypothetical protein S4CHLAM20_10270 [Chlamydiia bacterium]|nr:hypothetical protein [Chlamydiia bacterium]